MTASAQLVPPQRQGDGGMVSVGGCALRLEQEREDRCEQEEGREGDSGGCRAGGRGGGGGDVGGGDIARGNSSGC